MSTIDNMSLVCGCRTFYDSATVVNFPYHCMCTYTISQLKNDVKTMYFSFLKEIVTIISKMNMSDIIILAN